MNSTGAALKWGLLRLWGAALGALLGYFIGAALFFFFGVLSSGALSGWAQPLLHVRSPTIAVVGAVWGIWWVPRLWNQEKRRAAEVQRRLTESK